MSAIPELRKNQFGISVKTFRKFDKSQKLIDDILYFTVNHDKITFELYPHDPIIEIDKDAIKMILNKIAKIDNDRRIPNVDLDELHKIII